MQVCKYSGEGFNGVLPGTTPSHGAASEGVGGSSSTGSGYAGVQCIPHIHTAYRTKSGASQWPDLFLQGTAATCFIESVAVTYIK